MAQVELRDGDIFAADCEAIVCPVNCRGVMGKGLALQFKQRYPDNYAAYRQACLSGQLRMGQVLVYQRLGADNPRYIINFPTKAHWKDRSTIAHIRVGLAALSAQLLKHGIRSVALPALGCGLGGLAWDMVHREIINHFSTEHAELKVILFKPQSEFKTEINCFSMGV
jgi:O-acetyl-ADP-ribose deacetylase (regulator of RNase III)